MKFLEFFLVVFLFSFQAKSVELELPLDCNLGENCWISSLPRHYLGSNQVDFLCGTNTYNGHKGTDFSLKDYEQMQEGVRVLAPFDGEVVSIRDNILDMRGRIAGKVAAKGFECGNNVVIKNNGYEATLCHLKKNSLLVKKGDVVKAGEYIGMVGLSGNTEYPHLHLILSKDSRELDPFYGEQSDCGNKPRSLWKNKELFHKNARTGVVFNYGFAFNNPNSQQIRQGEFQKKQPPNPTSLVGFADIFSVNKDDKIILIVEDSDGKILIQRKHKFGKHQKKYFFFVSKNLRGQRLSGNYKLRVEYYHWKGKVDKYTETINL